jgi:hypothetical protein
MKKSLSTTLIISGLLLGVWAYHTTVGKPNAGATPASIEFEPSMSQKTTRPYPAMASQTETANPMNTDDLQLAPQATSANAPQSTPVYPARKIIIGGVNEVEVIHTKHLQKQWQGASVLEQYELKEVSAVNETERTGGGAATSAASSETTNATTTQVVTLIQQPDSNKKVIVEETTDPATNSTHVKEYYGTSIMLGGFDPVTTVEQLQETLGESGKVISKLGEDAFQVEIDINSTKEYGQKVAGMVNSLPEERM